MTKLLNKMLELSGMGGGAASGVSRDAAMHSVVDAADAHGNTLLSEAAAGGALSCVKLLLKVRQTDPYTPVHQRSVPCHYKSYRAKLSLNSLLADQLAASCHQL